MTQFTPSDQEIIKFYFDNNLTVVPVYPQTKVPCVNWKQYQEFKPSKDEISEWFRTWWNPNYWKTNTYAKSKWIQARREALLRENLSADEINKKPELLEYDGSISVAVLGGKISGNLALFDDDDAALTSSELEYYKEKTLVVQTASGFHIYLRLTNPPNGTQAGKKGELRGEGAYVIGPPSTHVLGTKYQIISTVKTIYQIEESKEKEFLQWVDDKLQIQQYSKENSPIVKVLNQNKELVCYAWHKRFLENYYVNDHLNELSLKLFAPSMAKVGTDKTIGAKAIYAWAEKCNQLKGAPLTVSIEKIEKMIDSAQRNDIIPMSKNGLKQRYPDMYQELIDAKIIVEGDWAEQRYETPEQLKKVSYEEANTFLLTGKWQVEKKFKDGVIIKTKEQKEKINNFSNNKPIESQQDRLIKYCLEEILEFFIDQHETPYARIKEQLPIAQFTQSTSLLGLAVPEKIFKDKNNEDTPNNREVAQIAQLKTRIVNLPIRSKKFKNWLSYLMYRREEKGCGTDAVNSAINVLAGKCQCEGKHYKLYNRVAPDCEGNIWIDMADDLWRAIKVTKEGWQIIDNPPILFRRYNHQKPIPLPIMPNSLTEAQEFAKLFFNHINVNDTEESINNQLSLICTIISYFIPTIPHPVMVVYGPQGSAKSYLHKLTRRLIDPSITELLTLPHDMNEVIQQLDHNWLCFYDNLSYMSDEVSDTFCMAATGAGFSKRELYSDDDDVIYDYKRCIGLNGINPAARRGDLLDRSILIELAMIKTRKTEAQIDKAFELDKCKILGGFLTILSEALKKYETIEVEGYQRLADFHKYGCAIAEAYGSTSKAFSQAYKNKVDNQTDETLNADSVGLAMIRWLETHFASNPETKKSLNEKWEGTPTELLDIINSIAHTLRISTSSDSHWPQSAQPFTRRLNGIIPALNKKGYDIISKSGTPRKIIIVPSIQQKLSIDEVWYFRSISKTEVVICANCHAPQARIQIKYPEGNIQSFCEQCFNNAKPIAEANGIKFIED